VPSPGPATSNRLSSVAATSATNAWAVGVASNNGSGDQTLVLHWNGSKWIRVASPSPGGTAVYSSLRGVVANSPGSAYAVGTTANGDQTLILHWNGTVWTQVPSPSLGTHDDLSGVGTTAAGNVWAVGSYTLGGPSLALAVHCC
jgi:hypothetical protein